MIAVKKARIADKQKGGKTMKRARLWGAFKERMVNVLFQSRLFIGLLAAVVLVPARAEENVPGTIVHYSDPATGVYFGNPGLVIMPNGDYIASHDIWPGVRTYLVRSQDAGKSWQLLNSLAGQYESSLFVLNGDLYLIGAYVDAEGSSIVVRKSTDGGIIWTAPSSSTSGRLVTAPLSRAYHAAASPAIVVNNRLWRAMEREDPDAYDDPSIPDASIFHSFVISAPVNSNLLDAASWTFSNELFLSDYLPKEYGWLEGCTVPAYPATSGFVVNMLRVSHHYEKAAMISISEDGSGASFDSNDGIIDFNGGMSKFEVHYDPESNRYWSLVNNRSDTNIVRNLLDLKSSPDLINWTIEATILYDPDPDYHGFQYASFLFDGDDIIAVVRTSVNGANSFHNSNYITFHRIHNFRALAQTSSVTLDAVADAEIDQHVNYMDNNLGSATAVRVETRSSAYTNPVESPESWMLVKWDLSSIPSADMISKATFCIAQLDYDVGTVDIYGINSGSWDEATVTWNNWVGSENLTYLGTMSSGAYYTDGTTTFSDDELIERVRAWVDGSQTNHGLLMKWSGGIGTGDTFATREHASLPPPQLIIEYTSTSISAVADAEIDQHVNYMDSNLGSETMARVETRSSAYTAPVVSPQSWMLVKWDLSDISSSESITGATLRIVQGDSSVGTAGIYAIDSGEWDEATVTWNNWVGSESLTFLGTMTNIAYPDGITTFTSTALEDRVADWVDGTKENHGIVIKWDGQSGGGDSFVTREHASLSPPKLIVSYNVVP